MRVIQSHTEVYNKTWAGWTGVDLKMVSHSSYPNSSFMAVSRDLLYILCQSKSKLFRYFTGKGKTPSGITGNARRSLESLLTLCTKPWPAQTFDCSHVTCHCSLKDYDTVAPCLNVLSMKQFLLPDQLTSILTLTHLLCA